MNNQGKPYFSVIVPVYNRCGEVRDLLESLSKQTDRDFEVMLVEDGSTERCDDIAQAYADKVDVHYFWKENDGRSIARNYGIERAKGDYFTILRGAEGFAEKAASGLLRRTRCRQRRLQRHAESHLVFDDGVPHHRRYQRWQGATRKVCATLVQYGLQPQSVGNRGRIP